MSTVRNLALSTAFALSATFAAAPHAAFALGSTPVTVTNPADIAKAEGIQHPFHAEIDCTVQDGFSCNGTFALSSSSNANQKITIEYVSGACNIDQGNGATRGHMILFDAVGNNPETKVIPISDHFGVNPGGEQILAFGQPTRLYAVPNGSIQVFFEAIKSDPTIFTCAYFLSGQGVDQ
jgi:hypothetical protein